MAIVIDAESLLQVTERLPTEAFFVDTNVIIDYADPFGDSTTKASLEKRNILITEILHRIKSQHKCFSTITVAIEYYKHIQVNFYNLHTQRKKFDSEHFKQLRNGDVEFIERWEVQMKQFKKLFRKKFPLYSSDISITELWDTFKPSEVDFGDHTLYATTKASVGNYQCIFSNDSDFYKYDEKLYLLTTNEKIIKKAKEDNLLYKKV
jgi:hypothetical protein